MKTMIFMVRDSAGEYFNFPFQSQNRQTAIRAFTDGLLDQSSVISQHPQDYELWHGGEFDNSDGSITCEGNPSFLINGVKALELRKKQTKKDGGNKK